MPKKLIIEYFGFRGEGSTAKEAKLEAGRKIAALHVALECRQKLSTTQEL